MITVSTMAGLLAALKGAAAGAIIALAPGAYDAYDAPIVGINPPGVVTIESADPARPAVLQGLKVANSSNLSFSGLELTTIGAKGPVDPYYAFRIQTSHDLAFTGVNVHGDPTVAPGLNITGFYVVGATRFSITGSRFHDLNAGAVINASDFVTVSNDSFTRLSKGGIEAGGTSDFTIAGNLFTDFHVLAPTHADGVQIYTAGTSASAHDIKITGNLYDRGAGDPIQAFFLQDEVGTLPLVNVTLTGNVALGCMWDCLYLMHPAGVVDIECNTALSWPGADREKQGAPTNPEVTTAFTAWLWLRGDVSGVTSLTLKGNSAQSYPTPSGGFVAVATAGNVLLPALSASTPTQP